MVLRKYFPVITTNVSATVSNSHLDHTVSTLTKTYLLINLYDITVTIAGAFNSNINIVADNSF